MPLLTVETCQMLEVTNSDAVPQRVALYFAIQTGSKDAIDRPAIKVRCVAIKLIQKQVQRGDRLLRFGLDCRRRKRQVEYDDIIKIMVL